MGEWTAANDLAMLLLRLTLGVMLISHGANKVWASGGLSGTARWFESLGLRPGWLHARLAASTELGAGVLLTLGLLTPLAVAGYVGLMVVAAFTDHHGKGFFVFKGGWEYVAVVALVAVAIASAGPGEWSLDHVVGWDEQITGIGWAIGAAALGVAGAGALLLRWREQIVAARQSS